LIVLRNGAPDSARCTRTVQLKPATLGFLRAHSAIIHRTIRCANGATATQRNGRLQKALTAQTIGVSDPGVPGPTSNFVTVCPCPDGLARDGTQGGMWHVLSRTRGVLVVGVTESRLEGG
jgi:hypothetical protein